MADRVSASIVIGGTLTQAAFLELVELIAAEHLSVDWDGEPFEPGHRSDGEPLSLHAHEIAPRAPTIESLCSAIAASLRRILWP